ncbi:alpha/beta hydrolase [uncultured Sphingomonas sp.]|uniref:alpha/beta hydrolase n=1 Tax=uncultured Sphingomonas sp. TaxID=158754 RepID=UPI0035CB32C9
MSGTEIDAIVARIHATYARWNRATPIATIRADWNALFPPPGADVDVEQVTIGGMPARWIAAPGTGRTRIFVYFHGGGYRAGSSDSHGDLVARLSAASGMAGLALDYPLVPEHPFPAAIDALEAFWRALLDIRDAGTVAWAGDSAGANLALAGLVRCARLGWPLPARVALLSPWTDLAARGDSYASRAAADPLHTRDGLLAMARAYLNGADPLDPLASPIAADMAGWPPMLVQVGDREVVLDDARGLVVRAAAGGDARLSVWPGMIHVFQQFAAELPEARAAIAEIGAFLKDTA